jgi:hypothetical protein
VTRVMIIIINIIIIIIIIIVVLERPRQVAQPLVQLPQHGRVADNG